MKKNHFRIIYKALVTFLVSITLLLLLAYGTALYFKKDMLTYFNTEINKQIKGTAHIRDLDFTIWQAFPSVSISLKDINIKDSLYQKDVMTVRRVFLQFSVLKLLRKQIEIKSAIYRDGTFALFRDSAGYTNMSAFQPRHRNTDTTANQSKSSLNLHLRKIVFENVTLTYQDPSKQKDIHILFKKVRTNVHKDSHQVTCRLKGDIHSDGLNFKKKKGPFVKDKDFEIDLNISYEIANRHIVLLASTIENEGHIYGVSGHMSLNQKPHKFALHIDSKNTDYEKALALLSTHLQKQLARFDVKGGILDCQVDLLIPLKGQHDPRALVAFQLKNTSLRVLDIRLDNTTLNGTFSNQKDSLKPTDDINSIVEVPSGTFVYHGIACSVKGVLTDLTNTKIKAYATAKAPLPRLHHFIDSTQYAFQSGDFDCAASYEGPLLDIRDSSVRLLNTAIKGKIAIHNGSVDMVGKNFNFKNINCKLKFTESDVALSALQFQINGNPVSIHGQMRSLFPFLLAPDRKAKVDLNLSSSNFDIDKVLPKQPPKSDDEIDSPPPQTEATEASKKQRKWVMERINRVLDRLELNFGLQVAKLHWHRMKNTNIDGNLTLAKNYLRVHDLHARLASGGTALINAEYHRKPHNRANLVMLAKLKELDASEFFYMFDDFNQKTITYQNLEGKINADISFACDLKDVYVPLQKSMKGEISLLISDGVLKNFAPFKNMDKIVSSRDLMNIQFDEINNRFLLQGHEIHIQKMQVNSSAISLFVEGIYSFKDKTDLSIKIPLANLKNKHDSAYYQVEEGTGVNLLLRAKEKEGKMTVVLDPFDRYHKGRKDQ
ncbi:MAG TPA: AsmA family protein [Cytophagales bacterium]|nr:AsmA family protein [Cytophagales bacterium]